MNKLLINKEIAGFILGWRYQLKCQGVARSRWRKLIAIRFQESKKMQGIEGRVELFCEAWDELVKLNLI